MMHISVRRKSYVQRSWNHMPAMKMKAHLSLRRFSMSDIVRSPDTLP